MDGAVDLPPKVECVLSETGGTLAPAIEALVDWAFLRSEPRGQPMEGT